MRAATRRVMVCGLGAIIASSFTSVAAASVPPIDSPARCCALAERLDPPAEPVGPVDDIVIIGDSLTLGITARAVLGDETLPAHLERIGITVDHDARKSRTLSDGIVVINAHASTIADADIVFLGLGTNNIYGNAGRSQADAEALILEVSDAVLRINPDTRVMWIELSVEDVAIRAARFNAALNDIDARFSRIETCAWHSIALAHPSWFERDRIHLNGTGYRAMRDVVFDCLTEVT